MIANWRLIINKKRKSISEPIFRQIKIHGQGGRPTFGKRIGNPTPCNILTSEQRRKISIVWTFYFWRGVGYPAPIYMPLIRHFDITVQGTYTVLEYFYGCRELEILHVSYFLRIVFIVAMNTYTTLKKYVVQIYCIFKKSSISLIHLTNINCHRKNKW